DSSVCQGYVKAERRDRHRLLREIGCSQLRMLRQQAIGALDRQDHSQYLPHDPAGVQVVHPVEVDALAMHHGQFIGAPVRMMHAPDILWFSTFETVAELVRRSLNPGDDFTIPSGISLGQTS